MFSELEYALGNGGTGGSVEVGSFLMGSLACESCTGGPEDTVQAGEGGHTGVPATLGLKWDPRQPCLLTSPAECIRCVLLCHHRSR